jgi:hypothetical protein
MPAPETLFSFASTLVVPGWLLLVFAPRWHWTNRILGSAALSLVLAALYLVLVAWRMPGAAGGFGSLADVDRFFRDPYLLLAGWIHYLAFDLFIGAWEVRDAQRLGLPHLLVVPCLVMTFLLGPSGLLAYVLLRCTLRRRFLLE